MTATEAKAMAALVPSLIESDFASPGCSVVSSSTGLLKFVSTLCDLSVDGFPIVAKGNNKV